MFPPGAAGVSPAYRNRGDTPRVLPEAAAYHRGVKTDDNVNFSAAAPVGPADGSIGEGGCAELHAVRDI